jgi:hypothetical protein
MRHELLPLAHRLRREGHEVNAFVWRSRFERAWGGQIEKIARHSDGTIFAETLSEPIEEAAKGNLIVLTTVRRVAELFHAAKHLYAVPGSLSTIAPIDRLLLGGWFDGETIQAPHLLVADWGAWTGGQGPHVLGGLTQIRLEREAPPFVSGALAAAVERMKSASFRGLFHCDVEEQATTGEMRLRGMSVGWPWLHVQSFVAELKSLSETLGGAPPTLLHKYVSVLPVTTPPWPNDKQQETVPGGTEIGGLTPQQQGRAFWFDLQVDKEAGKLRTAGLDGLLAVATGCSDSTPALARARALEIAVRMQVPAKQHRQDHGLLVDSVLSTLEDRWGFVA